MIRKFISIKNVGRFRNSAAKPMPALRECTFVFGPNGHGKTTVGAVLRSLQMQDADHILGRTTLSATDSPMVELLLDNETLKFDGTAWSGEGPPISIFDGDFVAENVHAGEVVSITQRRNLYRVIIGDEGVALAARDAELAETSRTLTGEITAAKRAIETHIPAGMTFGAFISLEEIPDLAAQIEELQRQTQSAVRAEAIRDRAGFQAIQFPGIPEQFLSLLARTIDDVAESAEQALAAHLAAHPVVGDGRSWIGAGLPGLEEGSCPFCGQDTEGLPLIGAFKAVFSDAYRELANDLESLRAELHSTLGPSAVDRLRFLAQGHTAALQFWSEHCALETEDLVFPMAFDPMMGELLAAAGALVQRKIAAPLQVIEVDETYLAAVANCEAFRAKAAAFNKAVEAANEIIEARREVTERYDAAVVQERLAKLQAIQTRYSDSVVNLCAEHERLVTAKREVDATKEEARQALNAHTEGVVKPYEARINELLGVFNAGFTIAETRHSYPSGLASSSYEIVIDGASVPLGDSETPRSEPSFKNTLSSGDRTTLALAFFLAHLERDPQIESRIVVFDDPFNSQDAYRRRQTILEILKVGRRCNQVIVLSHDQGFLKAIWDKVEPSRRVALNVVDHRAEGSKILEFDLDEACRGRTVADVDALQEFLTTGVGVPLDLIRKLRVVLETHCRMTYPGSFVPDDWLGDIVKKIREGGEEHPAFALYEELDEINDYSKEYHHGADPHDASEAPIDPVELGGFVARTLRIVNATTA